MSQDSNVDSRPPESPSEAPLAAAAEAAAPSAAAEPPAGRNEIIALPAAEPAATEPAPEASTDTKAAEASVAPETPAPTPRPEESSPLPALPPAPAFTSELPKRSQRPGALALLKLERVDADECFRLRPEGEIDSLATSIARLGQLFPVDLRLRPPDRFQIVCGYRRVAALRLLKRERVLARVHTDLSDEDALQLALADLLESRTATREELTALRDRLGAEERLSPAIADTLERAITPPGESLAPEMVDGPEEEVDLDELAQDLILRLSAVNQDLALVVELWNALEPSMRDALLEQLGYPEQIIGYLRTLR